VVTVPARSLAEEAGLRTPAKVVAARLRATGWLLATAQRGVYEFAPGSRTTRRFDKRFNVADGLLPFDPRSLTEAA
jgi:hypothetical protein